MSVIHVISSSVAVNGVTRANGSSTQTEETEHNWDMTLGIGADQALANFVFTIANIKSMYWLFDQDTTFETNSSSAPQETLTFTAGVPFIWDVRTPVTIGDIFAGNLTAGFVTTTVSTAIKIYIVSTI